MENGEWRMENGEWRMVDVPVGRSLPSLADDRVGRRPQRAQMAQEAQVEPDITCAARGQFEFSFLRWVNLQRSCDVRPICDVARSGDC